MALFVDASAIVGMMTREEDDEALAAAMSRSLDRVFSAVTYWEATTAVARKRQVPLDTARRELDRFIEDFALRPIPIGVDEARIALATWERYGKGNGHPAKLNMGDCLAYACAKANGAQLLYKGGDFSHTDLA